MHCESYKASLVVSQNKNLELEMTVIGLFQPWAASWYGSVFVDEGRGSCLDVCVSEEK